MVRNSILHHGEGVDLIPSNIELSGSEVRLINAISRESVLNCVNEVKKNYDYVLVDCMPSLGMLTINALAVADSVVRILNLLLKFTKIPLRNILLVTLRNEVK